jgi:hypothetical protein
MGGEAAAAGGGRFDPPQLPVEFMESMKRAVIEGRRPGMPMQDVATDRPPIRTHQELHEAHQRAKLAREAERRHAEDPEVQMDLVSKLSMMNQ